MIASMCWAAEVRIENNSLVVVVAKGGRIRRIVAEKIAHTENVAVGMVASNSAVFEVRIVNMESVAVVGKPVDNLQPLGERVANN